MAPICVSWVVVVSLSIVDSGSSYIVFIDGNIRISDFFKFLETPSKHLLCFKVRGWRKPNVTDGYQHVEDQDCIRYACTQWRCQGELPRYLHRERPDHIQLSESIGSTDTMPNTSRVRVPISSTCVTYISSAACTFSCP